ncbi:MAG: fibronectin type III domain-containing protein [Bacteroidia bacterium]
MLLAILAFGYQSKAQHYFSTDPQGTDYKIHISVTGLLTSYCTCGNYDTRFEASKTSFGNATKWFEYNIGAGSGSTSYDHIVGPSVYAEYYFTLYYTGWKCSSPAVCGACITASCATNVPANGAVGNTSSSIKKPRNVYATNDTSDTYVDIKWLKGTDIPDSRCKYKIYRNTTLIATVNGDVYSYRDNGLTPGSNYTYRVTTFTNDFGTGNHESSMFGSGAFDNGSTFTMNLQASDKAFTNRTLLTWNDISKQADEVEVSRIENGTPIQIAVVSKYSRQFSDADGIPGFTYNYMVKPVKVGVTYLADYDSGTRASNGVIKGKVVSQLNAGVSGVVVYADAWVKVNSNTVFRRYYDTTDQSGFYEIKDIYYHKTAEFKVYPVKPKHKFNSDTLWRTLDLDNPKLSGIDFTDTTVFTIKGNVAYPIEGAASASACGIGGVQILLNGKEITRTDGTGNYAFVIQDEGTYEIRPKYLHHSFNKSKETIFIKDNKLNLDFFDIQKDTIFVKVQGGCNTTIADYAKIRIRSTQNNFCYDTTIKTSLSGNAQLIVAAREYKVEVTDISPVNSNIMYQIGNKPVKLNLTSRDSFLQIDTLFTIDTIPNSYITLPGGRKDTIFGYYDTAFTYDSSKIAKRARAEFIYRAPITIGVNFTDFAEGMVCLPNPKGGNVTVPMIEKGSRYVATIEVMEGVSQCHIKEGKLRIYDYVSDKDKTPIEIPIKDGFAFYKIEAGNPEVAAGGDHPFQKLFYMLADVGFLDPVPYEQWVLVTGAKARDKTFTTRSAGIPFIVLHDPPGDQSYAFIEKGTTVSSIFSSEEFYGGSAGVAVDLRLGAGFKTPFSETKVGLAIEGKIEGGRDNFDRESKIINFTFNERFSTTDAEKQTGYPGDVFVGSAFNMLYALADAIKYDAAKCNVLRDTIVAIDPVGFATTFIYTEGFIKESLIPRLEELRRVAPRDSALALQVDISNWKEILRKNRINRDSLATQVSGAKGNISISNGASYEAFYEYDTVTTSTYEFNSFFNTEVFIGLHALTTAGVWSESKAGVIASVKYAYRENNGSGGQNKKTIGYHIEDNDDGDYHSIDLLNDVANGTPAFRLVSGATSCPHEINTQRRDLANITITPPERNNVPADGSAVFTLNIINNSQSNEPRDYNIFVLPASNPDGAVIEIGGQNINFVPAMFRLPARQKTQVKLTVKRGPLASQYKNLKLVIVAPCEPPLEQTTSADTMAFSVNFQSECSKVEIYRPVENWLQNASQGDYLDLAFTGYDANDPNLESLILEYRREGKGWEEAIEISKDSLVQKFYDAKVLTKYMPDGIYQLRAVANCKSAISSINYSEIVSGKIDRKTIELFGTPYPNDGILNVGEDIWVEFDKPVETAIKYLPGKMFLRRLDNNKSVPISYTINSNKLIIKPLGTILDSLEGVMLKATLIDIEDVSGNVIAAPIEWEFVVSRSPVFWQPNHISYSIDKGKNGSFKATLKNEGPTTGNFTITKYPIWLSPDLLLGTVGSLGGTQDVVFTITSGLNPGIYVDTIMAMAGAYKLKLYVKVEILSAQPRWVKQVLDPSKFEHSMNFIAQFSLTQLDNPLSSDLRDEIGVFIKDSLRGKGKIVYVPQLRKHMAFITVYSHSESLDSMTFRIWDAGPGIQYRAKEEKVFRKNTVLGQTSSPFILHPKGIYQTINMQKGWNWFGLYVKNNNQTPAGIFGKAAKDSMTIVKTRDDYKQYSSGGWYGNLDTVRAGIGYMVNVPKADTVEIYGTAYGNVITPIEGNMNWSWIGNSDLFGSVIKSKLRNLNSETNDIIKSQNEFAVFDKGINSWIGTLGYLEPGSGYKISVKTPGDIVPGETRKLYKTLPSWNLDFNGMEYNMNITAELLKGSQRVFDSHYLIGAFINGKCQGVAQPVYSDDLKRYIVFLTAFADSADLGKPVTLKLYDTDLGAEIPQTSASLTFVTDGIKGTIPEPFDMVINTSGVDRILKAQTSMLCYPNPFGSQIHLDLTLPKKDNVEIYITDAVGQKIETLHNGILTPGNHTWLWDGAKIPQGIYFCITRINGEVLRTTIMKK